MRLAVVEANPASPSVVPRPKTLSKIKSLPDPRPPKIPLYRAGASSGSKISAVGIFSVDIFGNNGLGMNDDTLDAMNQCERVLVIADRLRRLTPAAIEQRVRRRDACRRGRLGVAHHGNEHVQRTARMTSCQRADFGDGFGHV